MSLQSKISEALLAHKGKNRAPKKLIPGRRGDEHSAKQVDKRDKFEEKGAFGEDFHGRDVSDDEDEDYHPISKSSRRRISKSISRERAL